MHSSYIIFGYSVSSYWLMFGVGLLAMLVINCFRRKKMQYSIWKSLLCTVLVTFLGYAGAKLLYTAENIRTVMENGFHVGGLSFFGALYFIPFVVYLFKKITHKSFGQFMDYVSPGLIVFLAMMRVGCYLNGCCGGITYVRNDLVEAVVPTQLIECVADIAIFAVLLILEWQFEGKGLLYPFLMVFYGCVRFLLEFFRDTPKDWLYLSHGQWFAFLAVLAGWIVLKKIFSQMKNEKKTMKGKNTYRSTKKKRKH